MDPQVAHAREVAQLDQPRMPADRGLSSLGLIMQLGGSLMLGCMVLLLLLMWFDPTHWRGTPYYVPGEGRWLPVVLAALGALRSGFHRAAGTALLYGSRRGPFRPTFRYIGIAAVHTGLVLLFLVRDDSLPIELTVAISLALLAWPLALLVLLTRLRRLAGKGPTARLPMADDLGFEGTGAIMLLLGLYGAVTGLFLLYSSLAERLGIWRLGAWAPSDLTFGLGELLVAALWALLLARAVLHIMAGAKGVRGGDSKGAAKAATRYVNFGVRSSVVVAAPLLLVALPFAGVYPAGLVGLGVTVYLFVSWPLILRGFYADRSFSAVLAGIHDQSRPRAPDAGLTALGWLLLALGVFETSLAVLAALTHQFELPNAYALRLLYIAIGGYLDASVGVRWGQTNATPWWSVAVGLLQIWAALELIHMTDRHRLAALVYGVIASLMAVYLLMLPPIEKIDLLTGLPDLPAPGGVPALFSLALALVIPIGTIVLAIRSRIALPSAGTRERTRSR